MSKWLHQMWTTVRRWLSQDSIPHRINSFLVILETFERLMNRIQRPPPLLEYSPSYCTTAHQTLSQPTAAVHSPLSCLAIPSNRTHHNPTTGNSDCRERIRSGTLEKTELVGLCCFWGNVEHAEVRY